jgi:hypothetical protein
MVDLYVDGRYQQGRIPFRVQAATAAVLPLNESGEDDRGLLYGS